MKREKFKLFMYKHRKTIVIIAIFALASVIMFGCYYMPISQSKLPSIDTTVLGIIGTLLGAITGGIFTLIGSFWANSYHMRSQQNIKRKNIIYSPLYDELIDIHVNILPNYPFPTFVEFGNGPQTIWKHPQYHAWQRIKSDTRYLEVPKILKEQMEELYKSIEHYNEIRFKVNTESAIILNEVLVENHQSRCNVMNIGEILSSDILDNKDTDFFKKAFCGQKEIDILTRQKINREILEKANQNSIVIETRDKYTEWMNCQSKTLELLAILINQIAVKYEG